MRQQWKPAELIDNWTLGDEEISLINAISKNDYNRFGCGLLLKYFQVEGKFPNRKQDIPKVVIEHVAEQMHVQSSILQQYELQGRVAKRHRVEIRRFLCIRKGTVADANTVLNWLEAQNQLLEEHNFDRLKEIVYEKYKELKLEPPQPGRVDRIIRSAVNSADEQFYTITLKKLQAETLEKLETLLTINNGIAENTSPLFNLKSEAGAATLESVLAEITKLERIHSLSLPSDLFVGVSRKRLLWCKQRIAVEDLHEIRRHPPSIRYSLLAAFCHERKQEITDTLLELLINIIHKIGSRAVHRVNKRVIKEVKRVQGKNKLLFDVASASLDYPEGKVKEIIYPIAGEQTLRDLVQEFKLSGSYEQQVQTIMRGSYSNHYRHMVPVLLKVLTFCSTNEASKSMLIALDLIRKYADKNQVHYAETEQVPLENIVPDSWLPLVKQGRRINRISYELCVLKTLRDKLRCKEMYAQEAYRYRNPDEDLPADFAAKQKNTMLIYISRFQQMSLSLHRKKRCKKHSRCWMGVCQKTKRWKLL